MIDTTLTRDEVAHAVAACQAANRRPGLRPVWRAIVERTGKHPSFSTVSRYLAELQAAPAAAAVPVPAPPDQVVAQVQQLAPAMWLAALSAARKELASELLTQAEHLAAASERERELLAELDEAQAQAASADHQRQLAESRAVALQAQLDAQTAGLHTLADAQQSAAAGWAGRERELSARLAQLERETATLAAAAHHAREAGSTAVAARERLRDELAEAQRRADADLTLNVHLREQLTVRDEDLAALRARIATLSADERQAAINAAVAERQLLRRDPLLRELRTALARAGVRQPRQTPAAPAVKGFFHVS